MIFTKKYLIFQNLNMKGEALAAGGGAYVVLHWREIGREANTILEGGQSRGGQALEEHKWLTFSSN